MLKSIQVESKKITCWMNARNFGSHPQSLIFIHGSGSNSTAWAHQYGKLHKQYNIVSIDLPGHGQSQGSGETDVGNYSHWVKNILDVLELDRPLLIGHSLGAVIALLFAINYPQDISGVVAVGGGLKMPINPLLLEGLKKEPEETIKLICKFSLAKSNREKLFASIHKSLSQANVDVLHGDMLACSKVDLTGKMQKINMPALIICGAEDKMTPPEFSQQIASRIKEAELVLIEGAGHMAMMEKPAAFNDTINRFAATLPQAALTKKL